MPGRFWIPIVGVLLGLLLSGCDNGVRPVASNAMQSRQVLAHVDGEPVTTAQLTAAIESIPKPDRLDYLAPEARRDLLQTLIDRKLMAREALRLGLAASPPAEDDIDSAAVEQRLSQVYLDAQLAELPAPTEQDIELYYAANAAEFGLPERVQVTRLVFPGQAAARRALAAIEAGAEPASLNDDRLRATTFWLQRPPGELNAFEAAAFATPAGKAGPIVPVERGFCVFRIEERVGPVPRPLADVREEVIARLQTRQRADLLRELNARLREGAVIELDLQALDAFDWKDVAD